MTNTDITKKIQEVYKIDVDAIRNLSKLANDLTLNGKLVVPGGLEIQGEVTMNKGLKITGTLKGQGSNCLALVGGLNVKNGTVDINRSDTYQALNVNGVSQFNKIVKMTNAELRIDNGLNGKNGATHFNYQNKGKNYIRGTNLSIDTSNTQITKGTVHMKNTELRIDNGLNGKNGASHFNYVNSGRNYIRGTNLSIDTSNTQITKGDFIIDNKKVHMKNKELRIQNGKNGTTHFNYVNSGRNYIRGTNLDIDTSNTNIKHIKKNWYWKDGSYQSAPGLLVYMDRQSNHCPQGQFMSGIRWKRSGSKIQTSLLCSKFI